MKILTRYICGEILLNFEIALLTLSSLMMIYHAGRHINSVGAAMGLLEVLPLLIPSVLVFSIPLSILLATLLTFSRLSSDGEIHAMYSCKISPSLIVVPVFLLMMFLSLLSLANIQYGVPWSWDKISSLKYKTLINLVLHKMETDDRYIQENISFMRMGSKQDSPTSVLIRHSEGGITKEIVAEDYEAKADYGNSAIQLTLKNSHFTYVGSDSHFEGHSESSEFILPLKYKKEERRLANMNLGELMEYSVDMNQDERSRKKSVFEFHRKIANSVACLLLGVLGIFIGLRMNTGNKFLGVLTVMGLVLLVYLPLLTAGKWISLDSKLGFEPWLGAWLPFLVIGVITGFLRPNSKAT